MKKGSSNLIWVSGLAISGLTIGRLIHGTATMAYPPPSADSLSRTVWSRDSQSLKVKTSNKWQTFAAQFSETNKEERKSFEENVAPQNRRAALEALLSQGGPSGFDVEMSRMIDHLLVVWAEENFEEAWAWSLQIKRQGIQNFVTGRLLDVMVEKDLEHATILYLELSKTNPDLESKVPETVLANAALKNAETFLDFAGKLRLSKNPAQPCEFVKDFNFQQVVDGLAKLPRTEGDLLPVSFPENFYEAWAELDRDAAFASFTGGMLSGLGKFDIFLEGLEKHSNPEEVWSWVAEKIQESEVSSKAIRSGLGDLQSISLNGIIQALPDAASRDGFLLQVATEGGIVHGEDQMPSVAISAMSSPTIRLEAFTQMRKENRKPDISKVTDTDLQAWGVTRQQVTAIFQR
jgi:hypothetical protein